MEKAISSRSSSSSSGKQCATNHADGLSDGILIGVVSKYVPEIIDASEISKESVCEKHQALIVQCMERVNTSGGNCNHVFTQWNQCLAKDFGFI